MKESKVNEFLESALSSIKRVHGEVKLLSDDLEKFTAQWEFKTQTKVDEDYSQMSKKEINTIKNQIRLIDQPCSFLVTKLATKLEDLLVGISS